MHSELSDSAEQSFITRKSLNFRCSFLRLLILFSLDQAGPGGAIASSDQLTLSQPEGADFAHPITSTTGTPGLLDFPTALKYIWNDRIKDIVEKHF